MSNSLKTAVPQASLLESLRKNNPFTSNAAEEPWRKSFPDIASINRQVFEDIVALIESKASNPGTPLAGMILGEPGSGKTHLLRRILLACQGSESPALFVFVKPLINPKRPLHHLLQEMVNCLSKTSEGESEFSQLERLVAEIIRDYLRYHIGRNTQDATEQNRRFLERFESDIFHIFKNSQKVLAGSMKIIEKEAVTYLHSQMQEADKQFLNVIFQYKDTEKQGLVRDWLKGSILDSEDCEVLGVPSRVGLSDEAREQEAREIILTLGMLFTRYNLPMVICFDQLDNFNCSELIAGFTTMIHILVNNAANMLPLAFMLADSWNERFGKSRDRAFIDRMESNKLNLSGCNVDEARELVSQRIKQAFGEKTKETIAIEKWLLPQLELKLGPKSLTSPREVILLANQIIRNASEVSKPAFPTVAESMNSEYKASCENAAVDFDSWDPESEYLKKAAQLFLTNQKTTLSCESGENKYITWTGTLKTSGIQDGKEIPYACFVNTAKHWRTVLAILNRCLDFLKDHPDSICTYITDARCDFKPSWNVTNERRHEVEALGGNVVVLDQHAAVRWYGLVSLAWKVGSGDILLEDEQGIHTATEKDLSWFIKTKFSTHATEGLFERLTKKKRKPLIATSLKKTKKQTSPDILVKAMLDCLPKTYPVLAMDTLMIKLREKGINDTLEYCLEQIGKNQNVLTLFPSGKGFAIRRTI